jgi:anti-sigma regulatory factor (Ser/Thr protein kinase)
MPDESDAAIAHDVLAHLIRSRTVFRIDSELERIHSLLKQIQQRLQTLHALPASEVQSVADAVSAALMNAYSHGRPTNSKQSGSTATPGIEFELIHCTDHIRFTVADGGPGFDITIVNRADLTNIGTGFRTMFQSMDEIEFNASGNRITLTKTLTSTDTL